jgi:hypothetical protein
VAGPSVLFVVAILICFAAPGPARGYGGGSGEGVPAVQSGRETTGTTGVVQAAPRRESPVVGTLRSAAAGDRDPEVRMSAVASMGQFPEAGAARALDDVLTNDGEAPEVRAAAAVSLGRQQLPANAGRLRPHLDAADPLIRRHALMGLGLLRSAAHAGAMGGRLADPDEEVRRTAARALAFVGNDGALEALRSAARTDPSTPVRQEAIRTILQTGAPGVGDLLAGAAAADPDPEVRELAAEAIAPGAAPPARSLRGRRRVPRDGEEPPPVEPPSPSPPPLGSLDLLPPPPADVLAGPAGTVLSRTEGTANGESEHAQPGEALDAAIGRMAVHLAPGSGPDDGASLRTMHELAPLIDQAAFLGSRIVPLARPKGRWFLTAHRKVSEHENLVKTTFVNEQGALFTSASGQKHLAGSTYVVFRFADARGAPGALEGIGAYTYTRSGTPVFKHFSPSGTLDTFSTPQADPKTCFECHNNEAELRHSVDFTFDTFEKARQSGVARLMEEVRSQAPAAR